MRNRFLSIFNVENEHYRLFKSIPPDLLCKKGWSVKIKQTTLAPSWTVGKQTVHDTPP